VAWLCLVLWCCCSRPLADLGVVDILCVAVSSCLLKGVCVCGWWGAGCCGTQGCQATGC
jgi:hypothetical protein